MGENILYIISFIYQTLRMFMLLLLGKALRKQLSILQQLNPWLEEKVLRIPFVPRILIFPLRRRNNGVRLIKFTLNELWGSPEKGIVRDERKQ